MTRAYVGLGSNLRDRPRAIRRAVDEMVRIPHTEVLRVSSFYDCDPVGDPHQPSYLNAVVGLDTGLDADRLLWNLQLIETRLGRRAERRNGPRTIDLDLLFFGQERIERAGLRVPHPRLAERSFVLIPMVEIDPDWIDPRSGLRMDELVRERPNLDQVRWAGRFTVQQP